MSYSLNIPLLHTEGKNPSVKDTPVHPRLYILWMFSEGSENPTTNHSEFDF